MERYTLNEAQLHLKKLLTDAKEGKTVIIEDGTGSGVQLVPIITTTKPRTPGSAEGQIKMSADFDDPIPGFEPYTE